MSSFRKSTAGFLLIAGLALSACGGGSGSVGSGGLFGGSGANNNQQAAVQHSRKPEEKRETIWDLFKNVDDPNTTVEVNKYIWNATLETLNFMPLKAADPFTGIMVFDYGRPPGGGTAYKATVYVKDPALDARSLTVALYSRSGPASTAAVRRVEDAILTRARQLRIRDGGL